MQRPHAWRAWGLSRFIEEIYLPQKLRVTSEKTKSHYRLVVSSMTRVLRRQPRVADLTDATICNVLRFLASRGLSPHTIQQRRNYMVALANWCSRRGVVGWWVGVEPYPVPDVVPKAWTMDQLHRLWNACSQFPGPCGPGAAISLMTRMVATASLLQCPSGIAPLVAANG